MGDLVLTVSLTQVLPVILLAIVTMFAVIGNFVKGFEMDTSVADFWFELTIWTLTACSRDAPTCRRVKISDADTFVGNDCDSTLHHIKTAGAFGIITSVVAGISTILALVFFIRNNITKPKIFGICTSFLNFVLNIIAFILYVTIKEADCLEDLDIEVDAGAFMYLGAFIFSLISLAVYAMQDGSLLRGQQSSSQRAPHNDFNNNNAYNNNGNNNNFNNNNAYNNNGNNNNFNNNGNRQAPRVKPGQGNMRSVNVPQQQQQFQQTPPQQQYQPNNGNGSSPVQSKKVASPPTYGNHQAPVAPAPPAAPEDLWPDGDDWVVDPSSDLLWSETKHLFFDRQSGQFFDPKSDQWYDPERNNWYKIQ